MESLSKNYSVTVALIISSSIIGASYIISSLINKYEISTSSIGVYRLDKSTGKIDYCLTSLSDNRELWVVDCSGKYIP